MDIKRMIQPQRSWLLFCMFFICRILTAQDTTPPVFIQVPISLSVPCESPNLVQQFTSWYSTAGNATVFDNNGGPIQLIGSPAYAEALSIFNQSQDTLCGNTKNVEVIFIAVDQSGNSSVPAKAEFGTFDNTPPSITTSPVAFSGECTSNAQNELISWIKSRAGAIAVDACSDSVLWTNFVYTTSTNQSGQASIANGPYPVIPDDICLWSVNVSFFFTDDCGNNGATAIRKFELKDTKAPVFSSLPADLTVSCNAVPALPNITASDDCGGAVNVLFEETTTQSPDTNSCLHYQYIINRKWTASDNCSNTVQHTQIISVTDTEAPTLQYEDNQVIDCIYKDNLDSLLVSIQDNCSQVNLVYEDSLVLLNNCNSAFIRKYTVSDVCNNTRIYRQGINTIDQSAPIITKAATTKSFDCNISADLQAEFDLWLLSNGGAQAKDSCGVVSSFYAVPGSYILSDTSTFPGVTPINFTEEKCNTHLPGWSRLQTVDFVFIDQCGNAAVTSANFGVRDEVAPQILNCPIEIVRNIESSDCISSIDIQVPEVIDNCSGTESPILRMTSSPIKSVMPGANSVVVDTVILEFSNLDPNTFTINGSGRFSIEMVRVDADNDSEFFRIFDESGDFIGQTNIAAQPCQNVTTDIIDIPIVKLNEWVADGTVRFTLIPNLVSDPVLSINDICIGSRADATLTFPIDESNLIQSYFTIEGSGDTTVTTKAPSISRLLTTGNYEAKFVYTDCASNTSTCDLTINIRDVLPPNMMCNHDTVVYLKDDACSILTELPLEVLVSDNCQLTQVFNDVQPVNANSSLITFRYNETSGLHLANNKSITFNNVPRINNADNEAILEVTISGDINDATEYFDIRGEGGYLLGPTNRKIQDGCVTTTTSFSIPTTIYNSWASDGNVVITAIANNNAAEEGEGINPCIPLPPNQNIDNVSKMTMRLKVYDALLEYAVNNGNFTPLDQNEDSLTLNLPEGNNQIRFNTKDNYGNLTSCQFNVEVRDTIAPEARCKNFIARIHPSGLVDYTLHPDSINNQSTDNCSVDSIWVNPLTFNCSETGSEKTATLFVSDINGNTSSCQSIVRAESTILKPSYTAGLCEGDTLKLFANLPPPELSNTYQFRWSKDGVFVSSEENPFFISNGLLNNGIYTLEVTGFNGCKAEGSIQVNIQPLALPVVSADQNSYCLGDTFLIEATSYTGEVTYEWYEGFPPQGSLLSTTQIPQLQLVPTTGIHNYYVIVKNPDCVSSPSPTKRITIYPKPLVVVENPFQTICEGESITLSTTTGGPGFEYLWVGPNFQSNKKNPDPITNAQLSDQGSYTLTVNVGECVSDPATVNVVILPKPALPVISGEEIFCEGTTLSLAVTNLSVQDKYYWLKDGKLIRVETQNFFEIQNVQASASGSWQVVVESNTCLSDTSDIFNVEVADLSIIGASNTGPLCEGDSVTLLATLVPNATYLWKGPGDFTGLGPQIKTLAKSGDYTVTITSSTGCSNSTSTTVEVNKPPVITAMSNTPSLCLDGNTDIEFRPSITPSGNYTYKWTGPNNFMSSERNAIIQNAQPSDAGKYVFTAFNKNCPSLSDTTTLNITLTPPKANITGPTKVCEGSPIVFQTTDVAAGYIWVTPLGTFNSTQPEFTIPISTPSNQGNYHLLLEKDGCISETFDAIFVEINASPSLPLVMGTNDVCFGDTLSLTISGSDFDKVTWYLPNGSTSNAQPFSVISSTPVNEGNYKAEVEKDGCKSSLSQNFFVNVREEILPGAFAEEMMSICAGEETLTEICMDNTSLTSGAQYQWVLSSGEIIDTGEALCRNISGNVFKEGNNFLSISTVLDGCTSKTGKSLLVIKTLPPNIIAQANIEESFICQLDETVELISNVKEPVVDVSWKALTPGVELLSPNADKTLVNTFRPGQNFILLSYSKDGCLDFTFDTIVIRYNDAPDAIDDSFTVPFNTQTQINQLANDNVFSEYEITINASDLEGELNTDNNSLIYIPKTGFAGEEVFTYTLCIKGCPNLCDEAQVKLTIGANVECQPPTIFTPNGDGINDMYNIPCLDTERFPNNELYIYNQWGDQVFHANPYQNDWSGNFGGNPLPVGTYYFVFSPQKNVNPITGFIILQR